MNSARSHATRLVLGHSNLSDDFVQSQEFANLLLYFGTAIVVLFLVDIGARKIRR